MPRTYLDAELYEKIFEDFSIEDAQYIEKILEKFRGLNRKNCRILDVGCGTGRVGRIFSEKFHVIGLDVDINMLKIARSRIDVICCDISLMPIKSYSIDLAFSWLATLNYLTFTQLKNHIEEIDRILKSNSIYIIDMVLEGFKNNYYEESWNFRYDGRECTFRYCIRELDRSRWLEKFIIICEDLNVERSFIVHAHSYDSFINIVNSFFRVTIYRPFTFDIASSPVGRCVIVLQKI